MVRIQVVITASELMDFGIWSEVCALKGWNPHIVNEGVMDSNEEVTLSFDDLSSLGLSLDSLIARLKMRD